MKQICYLCARKQVCRIHTLLVLCSFLMVQFERCQEECLNIDEDGKCLESCPEGTFAFMPSCEDITMSQRTCLQPETRSMGYLCDYVRCDCLEKKYWDEAALKCVALEECSDQSEMKGKFSFEVLQ